MALHHFTFANAAKAHCYIKEYGSVEAALELVPSFKEWKREVNWKLDLDLSLRENITLITYFDKNYPFSLKNLADPPLLLYVKGDVELINQPALAIIGTRQCTFYGLEMAEKFGYELAANSLTIISGLARGVDAAAHKGALQTGKTIAILGSGLGHIYPGEHKPLAEKIAHQGALISEYPMQSHPEKHFFPKRNRLVSALSKGVLLIEAPLKSGAMITMDIALSQNKNCFALPGPIDRDSFRGNHFLIKSKKAQLVENVQDVLSTFKLNINSLVMNSAKTNIFMLDSAEQSLINLLPKDEVCIEEIALRTQLPIAKLNALLMGLVLKKVIQEYPGKFYKKVNSQ